MSVVNAINGINLNQTNNVKRYALEPSFGDNPNLAPEKNNSSGTKKVLIGAGSALAIAGSIIGGIMYVKKAKFNKAFNEIAESINKHVNQMKQDEFFTSRFDFSKIDQQVADELACIREEALATRNLDRLKQLDKEYSLCQSLMPNNLQHYGVKSIIQSPVTEDAKALKTIVENKGDFLPAKMHYLNELENIQKKFYQIPSKAAGKNTQETVDIFVNEKLLPQGIKPHTYDLSKEMDLGTVNYLSGTGYTEYMVRQNKITENTTSFMSGQVFSPYNSNPQKIKSIAYNPLVTSFKDNLTGTQVVSLKLPNCGKLTGQDGNVFYSIGVGNSNGVLTPLQKDLIEVGARLNESEILGFAKLLQKKENMDYDAILSLIQHYAKDESFMAREAAKIA